MLTWVCIIYHSGQFLEISLGKVYENENCCDWFCFCFLESLARPICLINGHYSNSSPFSEFCFFLAVLIERFCKQKIFEGLVLLGKAFGLEKRFSFLSSTGKRECVCGWGHVYDGFISMGTYCWWEKWFDEHHVIVPLGCLLLRFYTFFTSSFSLWNNAAAAAAAAALRLINCSNTCYSTFEEVGIACCCFFSFYLSLLGCAVGPALALTKLQETVSYPFNCL